MRPAVVALVIMACASGPTPEPTAVAPQVGCIMPTLRQSASAGSATVDGKVYEGKRLPEIVRIVGTYTDADGFPLLDEYGNEQWKILRSGEFNPDNWQPWAKNKITLGARCGREADAFRETLPQGEGRGR